MRGDKREEDNRVMFFALLKEAWISIGTTRLRTFLAMLGIVIGVGSVVLMLAIGAGSKRVVEESIHSLGSNLLLVYSGGSGKHQHLLMSNMLNAKDATAV